MEWGALILDINNIKSNLNQATVALTGLEKRNKEGKALLKLEDRGKENLTTHTHMLRH